MVNTRWRPKNGKPKRRVADLNENINNTFRQTLFQPQSAQISKIGLSCASNIFHYLSDKKTTTIA
jgi:hypothetical protein